jgi:hypothetical protein
MKTSFSLKEKRKIAEVFKVQRKIFDAGLSNAGYNNDHGGCPNCGDTGGFHTLMYELEKAFGLRNEPGDLNVKAIV